MDTVMGDEAAAYRLAVAAEIRALMGRGIDGERVTNTRLAAYLDLPDSSIGARLKGRVAFRVDELFKIAQLFDVQIDALIPPTDSLTTDRYTERLVTSTFAHAA